MIALHAGAAQFGCHLAGAGVHRAHIAAGTEGATCTRDDDGANLTVRADAQQRRFEAVAHFRIERILRLRPVPQQGGDVAFDAQFECGHKGFPGAWLAGYFINGGRRMYIGLRTAFRV